MRKQFFVKCKHFSPARHGMHSRHDGLAVRCVYGMGFVSSTPGAMVFRAKLDRKIAAKPQTTRLTGPSRSIFTDPQDSASCGRNHSSQLATRTLSSIRTSYSTDLSLSKFLLFAVSHALAAEISAAAFRNALSTSFPSLLACGIVACGSSDRTCSDSCSGNSIWALRSLIFLSEMITSWNISLNLSSFKHTYLCDQFLSTDYLSIYPPIGIMVQSAPVFSSKDWWWYWIFYYTSITGSNCTFWMCHDE